jgi:hypothetical protein
MDRKNIGNNTGTHTHTHTHAHTHTYTYTHTHMSSSFPKKIHTEDIANREEEQGIRQGWTDKQAGREREREGRGEKMERRGVGVPAVVPRSPQSSRGQTHNTSITCIHTRKQIISRHESDVAWLLQWHMGHWPGGPGCLRLLLS